MLRKLRCEEVVTLAVLLITFLIILQVKWKDQKFYTLEADNKEEALKNKVGRNNFSNRKVKRVANKQLSNELHSGTFEEILNKLGYFQLN